MKPLLTPNETAAPFNSIKLKQIFELFNMQNVITRDTRVTPTSNTLIDLIVTGPHAKIWSEIRDPIPWAFQTII